MAVRISLDAVTKLPLSRRVLILVVIDILIVGLAYWFFVSPKHDEVRGLKARLEELNIKLNENRAIASDIPKFQLEKEMLEEKLKMAVAQLPNEKEIPDLIESISEATKEAGQKTLLFKPKGEIAKGFYAEVPVDMVVEGRYESLFEFCDRVAKLPRIVNIGGINVLSTGHKNKVPVLKSQFVAITFRFIQAPGEGAQAGK